MLSDVFAYAPGDEFVLRSKSRPDLEYLMVVTPEGIVVHQGEGCEGELYSGPTGCWHSKQSTRDISMTTTTEETRAVAPYEAPLTPVEIKFNPGQIETLKNTLCRGATDDELDLFIAFCTRTGLDPFMRQVWPIKRSVKFKEQSHMEAGKKVVDEYEHYEEVLTIQVGIDGYRLIAERTGRYQGMDGPFWSDDGQKWSDFPEFANPKYAKVIVWRKDVQRGYVATVKWDSYHQQSPLWEKMGSDMLAKCAESLALRRAFPAEMSGLPGSPANEYEAAIGVTQEPNFEELAAAAGQIPSPAVDAAEGEYRDIDQPGEAQQAGEPVANDPPSEPAASPPEQGATQETGEPATDAAPRALGVTTSPATPPEEAPAPFPPEVKVAGLPSALYDLDSDKTMSERQRQALADWQAAIEGKHGRAALRAVAGWMQATYPYCVNPETKRPSSGLLKQLDAAELIGFMHHLHETKDGKVPDGGFKHDDFKYTADGKHLICGLCYVEQPKPVEEEEPPPFD